MKRFFTLWLTQIAAWNFLFWKETPGINLLLFVVMLIAALHLLYLDAWKRRVVQIAGLLTLLSAVMVLRHGGGWAVFATVFSTAVLSAAVTEKEFRSVLMPLLHIPARLLLMYSWILNQLRTNLSGYRGFRTAVFTVRNSLIPLFVAFLFLLLYSTGNPHFGSLVSRYFGWFTDLFQDLSFARFLFILAGSFVCGALLFQVKTGFESLGLHPDNLIRQKKTYSEAPGMVALRRTAKAGLMLLILLNVLLFLVNVTDLRKVWINFQVPEHFSLKQFVHEGTWILLTSVLFSIGVLLWLFRDNLHFYRKNRWLKILSYGWIFQNFLLVLSLFKRNYHYINFHGLAYGRIAVVVLLLLIISGLIAAYLKIKADKSAWFLIRVNSWTAYLFIIAISFVNWDRLIVNYNLQHSNAGQIDVDFYLDVRGNALPDVYQHIDRVKEQISAHNTNKEKWISYQNPDAFIAQLEIRKERFQHSRETKSWLSYNSDDERAIVQLNKTVKPITRGIGLSKIVLRRK